MSKDTSHSAFILPSDRLLLSILRYQTAPRLVLLLRGGRSRVGRCKRGSAYRGPGARQFSSDQVGWATRRRRRRPIERLSVGAQTRAQCRVCFASLSALGAPRSAAYRRRCGGGCQHGAQAIDDCSVAIVRDLI